MSQDNFDNMHKRLGANKLNEEEQKKLLEKFKKHGGVIKTPKKGTLRIPLKRSKWDKESFEKAKALKDSSLKDKSKIQKSKESIRSKDKAQWLIKKENGINDYVEIVKGKRRPFFERLTLNINTYLSGLTNLTGRRYKREFITKLTNNLENNLINLSMLCKRVSQPADVTLEESIRLGLSNDEYGYELLKLGEKVYKANDFANLRQILLNHKGDLDKDLIGDTLSMIYKTIHLYRPHRVLLESILQRACSLYLKKEKDKDVEKLSEGLKTILNNIFSTYLLMLHYCHCKTINMNIEIESYDNLNETLNITEEKTIDYIINNTIIEREELADAMETGHAKISEVLEDVKGKDDRDVELSDELKEGKEWIESLSYDKAGEANPSSLTNYINSDDKLYKVYVILDEFEKEFSFILTSNRIKFTIDWASGRRIDHKKELNDIYIELARVHDSLKEYGNLVKYINELELESTSTTLPEKLHKLGLERISKSRQIRELVIGVSYKLREITNNILSNKESIQSKDERLSFDNTLDGRKKLTNKTPVEAIEQCRNYMEYLKYLLEYGELKGSGVSLKESWQ